MNEEKSILKILLVVVLVLLLFGGYGIFGFAGGNYYTGFNSMNFILDILVIALLVFGIIWLVKNMDYITGRKN